VTLCCCIWFDFAVQIPALAALLSSRGAAASERTLSACLWAICNICVAHAPAKAAAAAGGVPAAALAAMAAHAQSNNVLSHACAVIRTCAYESGAAQEALGRLGAVRARALPPPVQPGPRGGDLTARRRAARRYLALSTR
jgi:hypothetical protein